MMIATPHDQVLRLYQDCRDREPTVWWVFSRLVRSHLILLNVLGTAACFLLLNGFPALALFMIGIALGVLVTTWWELRRTAREWPTLSQVLDWQKVDRILSESDNILTGTSAE